MVPDKSRTLAYYNLTQTSHPVSGAEIAINPAKSRKRFVSAGRRARKSTTSAQTANCVFPKFRRFLRLHIQKHAPISEDKAEQVMNHRNDRKHLLFVSVALLQNYETDCFRLCFPAFFYLSNFLKSPRFVTFQLVFFLKPVPFGHFCDI